MTVLDARYLDGSPFEWAKPPFSLNAPSAGPDGVSACAVPNPPAAHARTPTQRNHWLSPRTCDAALLAARPAMDSLPGSTVSAERAAFFIPGGAP